METALVAARFVHITALVMLFGAALFPFYAYNSGNPAKWPDGARLKALHIAAAMLALLGALAWFLFTTIAITGTLSLDALSAVARNTQFGELWMLRLGMLTIIALPLSFSRLRKSTAWSEMLTAAFLLGSLAGTGHAQSGENDFIHWGADSIHLLSAGAWIGGLLPLGFALAEQDNVHSILLRFSTMGVVAVSTLIVSGLINALFLVGSVHALFSAPYGWILLAKLMLFAAMLMFAARNRLVLMPRLSQDDGRVHSQLLRAVVAEQSLGFCVLAIVALLGTMEPAIGWLATRPSP